jgi:hypothetical protein
VAFDNAQNHSSGSNSVNATTTAMGSDTTAPTVPPGASGSALAFNSVRINWQSSIDNGGSGLDIYQIKRGASPGSLSVIGSVNSPTLTYTDNTAPQNTTLYYAVAARDHANNVSGNSNTVTVTTPLENVPPSAPGSPSVSGLSKYSVRVSWTASTDSGGSGVAGYKVYYAGNLISGTNPITTTYFDHTGLTPNTYYYPYTINAIDGAGNVSTAAGPVGGSTLPPFTTVVFQDDFNRFEDPLASGWTPGFWSASGAWAVLSMEFGWGQFDVWTSTANESHYQVQADILTNNAGLVFGVQGSGDRYRVKLASPAATLFRIVGGGEQFLASGSGCGSSNTLMVEADDATGQIRVTCGGNLVITYTASPGTLAGYMGLTGYFFSGSSYGAADNFVVRRY